MVKGYRGSYEVKKSLYDGNNIYVIAQYFSSNVKTGNAVQIHFVPVDMFADNGYNKNTVKSVCPDTCMLRDNNTCYVNVVHNTMPSVKAIQSNAYKLGIDYSELKGRFIRIGSYGDSTSIDYETVEKITQTADGFSNYTHFWNHCDERFNKIAMASVESVADKIAANSKGYRTFRIKTADMPLLDDEILCPNVVNESITCKLCRKCNGNTGKNKKNIAIDVHGVNFKIKRLNDLLPTL